MSVSRICQNFFGIDSNNYYKCSRSTQFIIIVIQVAIFYKFILPLLITITDPDQDSKNYAFQKFPNSTSIVEVEITQRIFHNVTVVMGNIQTPFYFQHLYFTFYVVILNIQTRDKFRCNYLPYYLTGQGKSISILSQDTYLDNYVNDWSAEQISSVYDLYDLNSVVNIEYPSHQKLLAIKYNALDVNECEYGSIFNWNMNQTFFEFIDFPSQYYDRLAIASVAIIYLGIPWILYAFLLIVLQYNSDGEVRTNRNHNQSNNNNNILNRLQTWRNSSNQNGNNNNNHIHNNQIHPQNPANYNIDMNIDITDGDIDNNPTFGQVTETPIEEFL